MGEVPANVQSTSATSSEVATAASAAAPYNANLLRLQAAASARRGGAGGSNIVPRSAAERSSLPHRTIEVDGRALLLELLMRQMAGERQGLDKAAIETHSSKM